MSDKAGGPRRGSSLFSGPGAMSGAPAAGGSGSNSQAMQTSPAADGAGGGRRNSSVLNVGPGGGVGFGIDFDDSDYEDSDDEDVPHGGPHAGQSAPTGSSGPNAHVTGTATSRPLVGGFAAAAYEAARAHHYQSMQKKGQQGGRGSEGQSQQPPRGRLH